MSRAALLKQKRGIFHAFGRYDRKTGRFPMKKACNLSLAIGHRPFYTE